MLPKTGKTFPASVRKDNAQQAYAAVVARALCKELGETHRAVKTVMQWTGANERTVKNWFAGTRGPNGGHLIAVVRHSDVVFADVMSLAGRNQAIAAKKLVDARDTLATMLTALVDLTT